MAGKHRHEWRFFASGSKQVLSGKLHNSDKIKDRLKFI